MLADPGRVHADPVGEDRLLADLEHELIGRAGVVRVMVVAEGEIAEFHAHFPFYASIGFRRMPICFTSTSTTSPGFMKTLGLRPKPTPLGEPVVITSPGLNR